VPPAPPGSQYAGYPQSNFPPSAHVPDAAPVNTSSSMGSGFPPPSSDASYPAPADSFLGSHAEDARASARDSFAPGPFGASGMYERSGQQASVTTPAMGSTSVFDQAYQWPSSASQASATPSRPSQPAFDAPAFFGSHAEEPRTSTRANTETLRPVAGSKHPASRGLRYAVFALLGLTVAFATYAVPRFASAGTGAIEVETVGDPDALVRVDGIVRGNPPLVVEGLEPGIHSVEIEASGYDIARADVAVEKGQARPIQLILEKSRGTDESAAAAAAAFAPALDPQITALPPTPEKPTKQVPRVQHNRVTASRATAELNEAAKNAAAAAPDSEESGASETQVAEELDEEMVAANEGELLISTVPWSHVLVDGEDTGRDTPVRALRVSPGSHKIGLRTPDEVLHTVDVVVEAGQVVRIIRRF
jgi:hypothetical protein